MVARAVVFAIVTSAIGAGCGDVRGAARPATPTGGTSATDGCVRDDDGGDRFPEKVAIEDAKNFSVEYHQTYKVVTVREPLRNGSTERYVLLQCGAARPRLEGPLAGAPVVQVPVGSLFSLSPTHLPPLVDLDRTGVLTGVPRLDAIGSAPIRERIRSGGVVEFAPLGVIDVERVVAARPSMLMSGGTDSAAFAPIRAAGVPVVANADWLESDALGRAEWIKYVAVFLNEERRANALFRGIKERYRELARRTSTIPESERPLVMSGRSTRGLFTIAGGRSYVARLIADAGGRYVWADNTASGTATVDLEAQIQRGADAAVWINGGGWKNRADMLADEPRYAAFAAYRNNQVWVYERQNAEGVNDYWSRSATRPDLLLADLIKILHPTLVPEHRFTWYVQVPST